MKDDEMIKTVEAMRQYIAEHIDEDFTVKDIAKHIGYSEVHCKRLFQNLTGKSIGKYIRLYRLTNAAKDIISGREQILHVALSHQYESHEGFTKAFSSAFGISPKAYRKSEKPIQYFIPYPVTPERFFTGKDDTTMAKQRTCTATFIERPACKLIYLPSKTGTDYWTFCQEAGCDWEGLLSSIPSKLDTPAFITLPEHLIPSGCAEGAAGIEVPADYSGDIPAGYHVAELQPRTLLYFQSEPFENEDDFGSAIGEAFKAYEAYNPAQFGYTFDTKAAPFFNFGASAASGAKIAAPVRKL